MKDGLIVLFGQWRNFESISQQMKDEFSKFDIIVSTWDSDYGFLNLSKKVTEDRVRKIFPNAISILIHNETEFDKKYESFGLNTGRMVHHWQAALPFIDVRYKLVVLQRFDLLCNTSVLLNETIKENKIYIDWGPWSQSDDGMRNIPWAQDWLFVGTSLSVRRWIKTFPQLDTFFIELQNLKHDIGPTAHIIIGKYMELYGIDNVLVLSNEFKKLWYKLIKRVPDNNEVLKPDVLRPYNEMGVRFLNLDINSKQFKIFYNDIMQMGGPWKDEGNRVYIDIDWE